MTPYYRTVLTNMLLGFAFAFMVFQTIEPAFAQTVVDMRPTANTVLEYVATTLAGVLTVLATFGVRFISSKIGMANSELEASLVRRLDEIIHRGIDYAYVTAQNEVNKPGSGLEAVKFDNWFMSIAASYINRSAPEIINRFKLSQARIEEMIMARLPAYVANVPIMGGLSLPEPTASVPAH